MYKRSTMVFNKTGLHAMPASDFVAEAKKYNSRISLARAPETMVELCAEGADENEAVDALVALIESGFGE